MKTLIEISAKQIGLILAILFISLSVNASEPNLEGSPSENGNSAKKENTVSISKEKNGAKSKTIASSAVNKVAEKKIEIQDNENYGFTAGYINLKKK